MSIPVFLGVDELRPIEDKEPLLPAHASLFRQVPVYMTAGDRWNDGRGAAWRGVACLVWLFGCLVGLQKEGAVKQLVVATVAPPTR